MLAGNAIGLCVRALCSAACLAVAAGGAVAFAQSFPTGTELHAGQLEVPLNKSQVVTADLPIARALIGNPEIADVFPISDRSVYVLGKALGTTSLTLYNNANRVISVIDIAVGPDVQALRKQIGELVPGEKIEARISNSSIVLSGLASDPGKADRAVQLAHAYAGDRVINLIGIGSSQQVMLEVKFAEVNRQIGEKLGVSGFGLSKGGTFSSAIGNGASYTGGTTGNVTTVLDANGNAVSVTTQGTPPQLLLGGITDAYGIFNKSFSIGRIDIDATLDALERKGLVHTLAEPTLVALSGEKASFLAGGEFPIPVAQNGNNGGNGGGITVEFKPFGVGLGFTPTVLGDSVINLIVEPEVSSIDPAASVTVNGITVPGLQTRRASTIIELRDGESFAIAGLLRSDVTTSARQLPFLGSIPILGTLFRSTEFQKGETELLIVVTPRLVKPIRPDQVRLPTDRVKQPDALDTMLNGSTKRTRELPPAPPSPAEMGSPTSQAPPKEPAPVLAQSYPGSREDGEEDGYEY